MAEPTPDTSVEITPTPALAPTPAMTPAHASIGSTVSEADRKPQPTPTPEASEKVHATPMPGPTPVLTISPTEPCYGDYSNLLETSGDDFVRAVLQAEANCIQELEWVGDSWLQAKVSDEESLITVANAFRKIVNESGRAALPDIDQLATYLIQARDIHFWCRQEGSCEGPAWNHAKYYPTSYGTPVYEASKEAVDAFLEMANDEGGGIEERVHNLAELAQMVSLMNLQGEYFSLMAEWINRWDENKAASEESQEAMWQMLELIYWGHRNPEVGTAFAQNAELLQALRDFVLDPRWLGTQSHWIMDRFSLEIGRYTKYKHTANYHDAVPVIKSVINAYQDNPEGRSIWLRILSEIDYNDPDSCERYGICHWYDGKGFQANFRKAVFPHVLQCPKTACEGNSITIHAQDLGPEKLTLACDRLYNISASFQEFCETGCQPVTGDLNNKLEIFIFKDGPSCDALEAGSWGGWPDACSGIFWEGEPRNPYSPAEFVATEFTEYENPLDPDIAIWNFEHEYVHYLDGRYNRAGGYRDDPTIQWWIEGFAEYYAAETSPYINPPPRHSPYMMMEILLESGSIPTAYSDRHLAVRFLLENHRDFIDQLLALMRQGKYINYVKAMKEKAPMLEEEWQAWLRESPQ